MYLRIPLTIFSLALFALGCSQAKEAIAAGETLALAAKPRADELLWKKINKQIENNRSKYSIWLVNRNYDAIEEEFEHILRQYRTGKLSVLGFKIALWAFNRKEGDVHQLQYLEQWRKSHPSSFIARFSEAVEHIELASDELGQTGFDAPQPTDERKARAAQYAQPAIDLLNQLLVDTQDSALRIQIYGALVIALHYTNAQDSLLERLLTSKRSLNDCDRSPLWGLIKYAPETEFTALCNAYKENPNSISVFTDYYLLSGPPYRENYDIGDQLVEEVAEEGKIKLSKLDVLRAFTLENKAAFERDATSAKEAAFEHMLAASTLYPTTPEDLLARKYHALHQAGLLAMNQLNAPYKAKDVYAQLIKLNSQDAEAYYALAKIHEDQRDWQQYLESLSTAAKLGYKEAQAKLGYEYMLGQHGLKKNLSMAQAWLKLAAAQNSEKAKDWLMMLDSLQSHTTVH